jgi:hypothetical protein
MMEAELRTTVKQGTHSKFPGEDGIRTEFYLAYWEIAKSDPPIFSSALRKGSLDRNQSVRSENRKTLSTCATVKRRLQNTCKNHIYPTMTYPDGHHAPGAKQRYTWT